MSAFIAPSPMSPTFARDPETDRIFNAHQRAARELCAGLGMDPAAFPAFQFRGQGPRVRFNLPYMARK